MPRMISCHDCRSIIPSDSGYWQDLDGTALSRPRCRDCHERAVRQSLTKSRDRLSGQCFGEFRQKGERSM